MDRRWFPARKCKRDDALGIWPCVSIQAGPLPTAVPPATTQFAATGDPRIDQLAPSLVMVTFDMPYSISGVTEKNYHGYRPHRRCETRVWWSWTAIPSP